MFVAIGSNSNIGELGPDAEQGRAGIWRLDLATRELVPFAKGLRNPVGMAWHSPTDTLWTVVNERDQLGNDLVPDYLAQVNEGDDFGWPAHYWGILQDPRVSRDWSSQTTAEREGESLSETPVNGIWFRARTSKGLVNSTATHPKLRTRCPHRIARARFLLKPLHPQSQKSRHHYAARLLEP